MPDCDGPQTSYRLPRNAGRYQSGSRHQADTSARVSSHHTWMASRETAIGAIVSVSLSHTVLQCSLPAIHIGRRTSDLTTVTGQWPVARVKRGRPLTHEPNRSRKQHEQSWLSTRPICAAHHEQHEVRRDSHNATPTRNRVASTRTTGVECVCGALVSRRESKGKHALGSERERERVLVVSWHSSPLTH